MERSTSSGSLCVEGERVVFVVGGGSLTFDNIRIFPTTVLVYEIGKQMTKRTR